jgi:hypothetical protein
MRGRLVKLATRLVAPGLAAAGFGCLGESVDRPEFEEAPETSAWEVGVPILDIAPRPSRPDEFAILAGPRTRGTVVSADLAERIPGVDGPSSIVIDPVAGRIAWVGGAPGSALEPARDALHLLDFRSSAAPLRIEAGAIVSLGLSPAGDVHAVVDGAPHGWSVRRFRVDTGGAIEEERVAEGSGRLIAGTLQSSGRRVAVLDGETPSGAFVLHVRDLISGRAWELPGNRLEPLAFAPSGDSVLVRGVTGQASLLDLTPEVPAIRDTLPWYYVPGGVVWSRSGIYRMVAGGAYHRAYWDGHEWRSEVRAATFEQLVPTADYGDPWRLDESSEIDVEIARVTPHEPIAPGRQVSLAPGVFNPEEQHLAWSADGTALAARTGRAGEAGGDSIVILRDGSASGYALGRDFEAIAWLPGRDELLLARNAAGTIEVWSWAPGDADGRLLHRLSRSHVRAMRLDASPATLDPLLFLLVYDPSPHTVVLQIPLDGTEPEEMLSTEGWVSGSLPADNELFGVFGRAILIGREFPFFRLLPLEHPDAAILLFLNGLGSAAPQFYSTRPYVLMYDRTGGVTDLLRAEKIVREAVR